MSATFDLLIRDGIAATPNGIAEADIGVIAGPDRRHRRAGRAPRRPRPSTPRGCTSCPASSTPRSISASPATRTRKTWRAAAARRCWAASPPCSRCPTPIRRPRRAPRSRTSSRAPRTACIATMRSMSAPRPQNVGALGELERLPGVCGVKAFLGSSTGTLLLSHPDDILAALKSGTRPHGGAFRGRGPAEGAQASARHRRSAHAIRCGAMSETARASTERVLRLAREAGRRLHVLHVTTADELPLLADARDLATVETTPQHLTLAAPECYERLGTYAQMNPPIREASHREALWQAVNEGLDRRHRLRPRAAYARRERQDLSRYAVRHAGRADAWRRSCSIT